MPDGRTAFAVRKYGGDPWRDSSRGLSRSGSHAARGKRRGGKAGIERKHPDATNSARDRQGRAPSPVDFGLFAQLAALVAILVQVWFMGLHANHRKIAGRNRLSFPSGRVLIDAARFSTSCDPLYEEALPHHLPHHLAAGLRVLRSVGATHFCPLPCKCFPGVTNRLPVKGVLRRLSILVAGIVPRGLPRRSSGAALERQRFKGVRRLCQLRLSRAGAGTKRVIDP